QFKPEGVAPGFLLRPGLACLARRFSPLRLVSQGGISMTMDRRVFLSTAAAGALAAAAPSARADEPAVKSPAARNRIGVSTYSFWQFRNKELRDIEKCIDLAADMGFDGVEI